MVKKNSNLLEGDSILSRWWWWCTERDLRQNESHPAPIYNERGGCVGRISFLCFWWDEKPPTRWACGGSTCSSKAFLRVSSGRPLPTLELMLSDAGGERLRSRQETVAMSRLTEGCQATRVGRGGRRSGEWGELIDSVGRASQRSSWALWRR